MAEWLVLDLNSEHKVSAGAGILLMTVRRFIAQTLSF